MANSDITKIAEINQIYLVDFLTFLTYQIKKQSVDEQEESFQQKLRDAKRRH